jgi:S1-C subfamily serine protease
MSNLNNLEKHELFLYPIVRIFAKKAAGSGIIVSSKPDPDNADEYMTFVLTNEHVIDDLVTTKTSWDSMLKRNVEKEFKEKANVEVFSYIRTSLVDSSNRYTADVIAYDKDHDMAVLKIDSPRKFDYVAKILPKEKIKDLRLFTDVVVSGCSLAHEPFCNFGQLTFLKEIIDQKKYVMTNANAIFGNSGGALFLADTGELIGIVSRISGIQLGFGVDIITWMGFAAHPDRIYEFLEEQELQFIYDPNDTFKAGMERRKKKEQDALMAMKAEFLRNEVASQ